MKRYAIADEVPEDCDYLTAGKEYEIRDAAPTYKGCFWTKDNDGDRILIGGGQCPHINYQSWRIVEREECK